MDKQNLRHMLDELVIKEKWADFLKRFIDVLRVNIFVVDFEGKLLIPPYRDSSHRGYGVEFLNRSFNFDFSAQEYNMLEDFVQHGTYWETRDPFDFHVFSIPIKIADDKVLAYLIVGPVILNKRWESEAYTNMAKRLHIEVDDLVDRIHEIRVVSFVSIKAILDLLAKVVNDILDLNLEMKELHETKINKDILAREISETARDLYTTVHMDELLITILDVALNMSQAENGSIMLLDDSTHELRVKVSRGMDEDIAQNARVKLGEGISGLVAQDNRSRIISGRVDDDNRLRPYLKRPHIKRSIVVPLSEEQRVFGVLNLHTEKSTDNLPADLSNLEHLSKLISRVLRSPEFN